MSAADHEAAIRAARRYLLRHDSRFYGPTKGDKCGCDECKVIRPLVGLLQQARLENERLRWEASAVADTRSGGETA